MWSPLLFIVPRARRCAAPVVRRAVSLALLIGFSFFGCAEPPTVPRAPESAQPSLSPSSEVLASTAYYSQEYSWYSGRTATNMGSTTGRVCFLTEVAGTFSTSNRWVHVYSSYGSWYLYGSPVGVRATARCSNAYSYTAEYSWYQGSNPTYMGSIYGRACFLTRVGGQFTQSTTQRVEVYSGNSTSWWLGGSSTWFGVHARARCIIYPPVGPQQPYGYTGWVTSSSGPRVLQQTTWACYLAGVSGALDLPQYSFVRVYTSGSWWFVIARGDGARNAAKAGCTSV